MKGIKLIPCWKKASEPESNCKHEVISIRLIDGNLICPGFKSIKALYLRGAGMGIADIERYILSPHPHST